MTPEEIRIALQKPTITVDTAGRILKLSRNATYDAVRRGDIEHITLGRRILVLTIPLKKMLGMEP